MGRLCTGIELHASGEVSADPVVGVCWDADRLHLPRVGITPQAGLLSTVAGREHERVLAAEKLGAASWQDVWRLLP